MFCFLLKAFFLWFSSYGFLRTHGISDTQTEILGDLLLIYLSEGASIEEGQADYTYAFS